VDGYFAPGVVGRKGGIAKRQIIGHRSLIFRSVSLFQHDFHSFPKNLHRPQISGALYQSSTGKTDPNG
jgi:hypothetical protein